VAAQPAGQFAVAQIPKFALIAAIAAASIASPVLAQSFDPEAGSGNVAGFG